MTANNGKPVTLSLGEVLWDMLPDGKALGGAPANVARHLAQFGFEAHLVSAVGGDGLGREAVASLSAMGVKTDRVAVVEGADTGTVDVVLTGAGNACYVIHEGVAWDHTPLTAETLALAKRARAINFGSLGFRCETSRRTGFAVLEAAPADCLRVFDFNLRPPFVYQGLVQRLVENATVVKMNEEELAATADIFYFSKTPECAIGDLLNWNPYLEHVIVTRGEKGAWWHNRRTLLERRPAGGARVADTIGAGDSFTAAVIAGLLRGMGEEETLEAALAVASFVCTRRGGMPELPSELTALLMGG